VRLALRAVSLPSLAVALCAGCGNPSGPGSARDVITVQNVSRLRRIASLSMPASAIGFVAFSPDDSLLLTKDRTGEVLAWETSDWSRSTLQPPFYTPQQADSALVPFYPTIALGPDGRVMATVTSARGDVSVREVGGAELSTFAYGSQIYAVAISPDGRLVAVGGLNGDVVVRELATGAPVADLVCDRQFVSVLVFSPDGRTLVAGYERPGNLMKAWSTSTWQETATFSVMAERVDFHDAAFTPDGGHLVIARVGLTEPNVIEVLDASTYQVVRRISSQVSAYQLAFSPDGSLLASSWGSVELWQGATSASARSISSGGAETLSVAFSPDGTLLAFGVGGVGVQVWAVAR